jgi:uncharacterized repeat protein (TIGR03803 family)
MGSDAAAASANAHVASGSEKLPYSFAGGTDGEIPEAAPISNGGEFYGTTALGGNGGCAPIQGCGTVYKVDASGKESILHVSRVGATAKHREAR